MHDILIVCVHVKAIVNSFSALYVIILYLEYNAR
jgi:hypothetical protein